MIEVEDARKKIQDVMFKQKTIETIFILNAKGRVCAKDIFAKINIPPFPRAGMDGYALNADDTKGASKENPISLKVVGAAYAGDSKIDIEDISKVAYKIMTGAPIPSCFDAVIKQELTNRGSKEVEVYQEIKKGKNYSKIGEDVSLNQKLVSKHQLINSRAIGILAAQGIETIDVLAPMKVGILSTGSELISLGNELSFGKIYDSNLYTIASFIESSVNEIVFKNSCADDIEIISDIVKEKISQVDVLITTGGVSVGEKDYLSKVIDNVGGEELFHFVNMKPGTPMMASLYNDKIILSLSGNPFASVVNLHLFYWSTLSHFMSCNELNLSKREVQLNDDLEYTGIRKFIRAYENNGVVSLISDNNYASVFHNTLNTNCVIDQAAKTSLKYGDIVTVYYWKD